MTYGHVIDPSSRPAEQVDFPGFADSTRFAYFPRYVYSLELDDFLELMDFLQGAPVYGVRKAPVSVDW